jgi:hypothetical protein
MIPGKRIWVAQPRRIEQLPLQRSMAVYFIVAVAVAVEHQPHETAADHERKNDAEDHSYVAMDAHLRSTAFQA